jgi:glycosyltransferase involved in cell wall biosynthesis
VTFLPYQPREELPLSLTCADAQLVTLADGLAGLLVPSKIYGALAAGVPVLYVGPPAGRVFRAVTEGGAGRAVRNGDAASLARAVAELADDPSERTACATRARALFDARYGRERSLAKHAALLARVHRGDACC